MNTQTDTPAADPQPAATMNTVPTTPSTFEDCVLVIDAGLAETNIDNIKAVLNKLKGFFKSRIGKKRSDEQKDSTSTVRAAIANRRGPAKPFEPKAINEAPTGSLFS